MTIHDLAERFGVSPRTIHKWVRRGIVPKPWGHAASSRYGLPHVEAIQAWLALRHHFVSGEQALAHCRQRGITLAQYLREREASVKEFGIGCA